MTANGTCEHFHINITDRPKMNFQNQGFKKLGAQTGNFWYKSKSSVQPTHRDGHNRMCYQQQSVWQLTD